MCLNSTDMKVRVVFLIAAVVCLGCGIGVTEAPAEIVKEPVGDLLRPPETRAEVHQFAADAARAAGAPLVVQHEDKANCDSESQSYVLDVYRIDGEYAIDVPPEGRAAAVRKIRAWWRSQGLEFLDDPRPNDIGARNSRVTVGVRPASAGNVLPMYVISDCRTNPDSVSPSPSR